MPLLVLLVGGTIQVCDYLFLEEALTTAAYAGTLEVSRNGSTEDSVRSRIEQSLAASQVNGATITITAADGSAFDDLPLGENAKIVVKAPTASNIRLTGFVTGQTTLKVVMQAVK
ncbi:MAG: hypothetical protein D6753_00280 [Planctomycetota bacterium]|nr:MAG: hypothetical protein D6753_00280 [Planctomycetota bacterium]